MARPKHADAGRTRGRILAAAGEAFAAGGREGASIRQIAAAAGVSLAMVHHYFGSKDQLHEACIEEMYRQLAGLRTSLLAELGAGGDLEALLERAVRLGFRFARGNQIPGRLLFREIAARGQLDERRQEAHQRPFLDGVAAALAAATGRAAASLRLPLQSAVMLIARYAISSDAELSLFAGDAADPVAAAEDHLVAVATAILLTPRGTP